MFRKIDQDLVHRLEYVRRSRITCEVRMLQGGVEAGGDYKATEPQGGWGRREGKGGREKPSQCRPRAKNQSREC